MPMPLPERETRVLLQVARASIEHGLLHGTPLPADPARHAEPLRRLAATFVTLRQRDGALRGCIGELEPRFALVESTARNAFGAAFRDPRFEPVGRAELDALALHVSVLGPLEPLGSGVEREALCRTLRPGIDGLVLDDGLHRATFLPAVWESLPEPERFVGELARKAGLAENAWSPAMQAWRYEVEELG